MKQAKHDTSEWREKRNRFLTQWIEDPHAVAWLLDYYDVCELFDDLIDKDVSITRARVYRALFGALVDMPGNPFFLANAGALIPVIHMGINAWMDANDIEDEAAGDGEELHLSYVMRAAYMQVTQTVIELTQGRDIMRDLSLEVVRFFCTETFQQYRDEIREEK